VAAIAAMSGRPVMKAIAVTAPEDVRRAHEYREVADYILFDSRPGPAVERPGGVGLAFDWRMLSGISLARPFGVAGGLNADNVMRAISIARPAFVDASSGVEDAPGRKNPDKIARFVSAARGAAMAPETAGERT